MIEQHAIGLHDEARRAVWPEHVAKSVGHLDQGWYAREQRLSAVEHDPGGGQAVPKRVLADTQPGRPPHRRAHGGGSVAPGLVTQRVHVAVIARQVAPLMNLEDELA